MAVQRTDWLGLWVKEYGHYDLEWKCVEEEYAVRVYYYCTVFDGNSTRKSRSVDVVITPLYLNGTKWIVLLVDNNGVAFHNR